MPKRLIHRLRTDCVAEFLDASMSRFQEGVGLHQSANGLAAIYLWGYSAEMILKAAYFSVLGFDSRQPILKTDLWNAWSRAKHLNVPWPQIRNLHCVEGWAGLIVQERVLLGRALTPSIGHALAGKAATIQLHWRETLRYHSNRPYSFEIQQTRQASQWLLNNYSHLGE